MEDTARTHAVVSVIHGHVDVAIFTPPGAPRVSDDEDFLTVHDLPANSGDGVVKIVVVRAVSGGHDTTGVAHEGTVGLNSEGDGTLAESFLHTIGSTVNVVNIVGRNVLSRFGTLAGFDTSNVRVVSGQDDWELSSGLVERDGPATVATLAVAIVRVAINNLLLSKGLNLLVVLDGHGTFEHSHGREGVAGTALTLVLNRNNNVVTPDEFAGASRALGLWLGFRIGVVFLFLIIVFLFIVFIIVVVFEAAFDGTLSNSSVLHDAHPPVIELSFGPTLLKLFLALLFFLASHISIILSVELLVKSLAGFVRLFPLLVVKLLVLFS